MATKREQIIARAKEIIHEHPSYGKDKINRILKSEYGVGLRRIEVAKLKKTIVSPVIREQILQAQRYQSLRNKGFIPEEAQYYSQFPISRAGMQKVVRLRKKEVREASEEGITEKQMPNYIKNSYLVQGFVTKQNRIDVHDRNRRVVDELSKPYRKREPLVIPPKKYDSFLKVAKQTSKDKVTPIHVYNMATAIPISRLGERLSQYRLLRQNHFSADEAIRIITAQTPKDQEGKTFLQKLDLTHPLWIQHIQDRANWYNQQVKAFMAKNMTRGQAHNAVMRELRLYYEKDKKRKPWDWLSDFSPTKSKTGRKQMDFVDYSKNAKAREDRILKKKMPYRAR